MPEEVVCKALDQTSVDLLGDEPQTPACPPARVTRLRVVEGGEADSDIWLSKVYESHRGGGQPPRLAGSIGTD
jgi:hypothetical protein